MWFAELRRSLSVRLVIWFAAAATALVVLTAALLYMALARGVEARDDQVLLKRAATVRGLLQAAKIDVDYLDHEVSEDLEGPRQLFMRISGPPAVGVHETPLMPEVLHAAAWTAPQGLAFDKYAFDVVADRTGGRYRTLTLRTRTSAATGALPVTIQMALDTTLDASVLNQYAELGLFVVAGALLASVFAGYWIVQAQLAPLRRLSQQVMGFKHSTLDRRLNVAGLPAELAEFATQFNAIIGRLEAAYEQLKRYADDVAHELRTPLNRIQLEAEVALRNARTPEEYRNALGSALEECEHLNSMVKSMLFIARAESGRAVVHNQDFKLAERLEVIRAFFADSAEEAGIKLTLTCNPDLSLNADPALLQRAVSNLVANSIEHTPKGGEIKLSAAAEPEGVVIEIADTGGGIAPEHQPYVFDRFFRADSARGSEKDRVGLGLAIAKSIVDLHGGRIALTSASEQGTRFLLHFPATAERAIQSNLPHTG